jgi:DNA polymerase I
MSCDCAGLPTSFDRFRQIWNHDFEFRSDANGLPVPIALFAREYRSGAEITMDRGQLLACARAPFDTGSDVLVTSYSIVAELSCFRALRWPVPQHVLCSYFETAAAINGLDIVGLTGKRPKLVEACELFGIPHIDVADKARIISTILSKDEYDPEEWRAIAAMNRRDVAQEAALFATIARSIDVAAALFRGRYAKAVVEMEAHGIPVDTDYIAALTAQWQALRMHYIAHNDQFGVYDESGSFRLERMEALIEQHGWGAGWPRTATGRLELRSKTIGKQCRHHPELRALQKLRDTIAELRLGAFLNTIGADGCSRCPIMPFWTKSGRNQPQGRDLAFLLSLPSWVHGAIKPPAGWGVACLDWSAQEIGIAAGASGDPALIADFQSGDPHMRFAIRAGLAPDWATRRSHGPVRDAVKPISLGVNYGMSKYGAAAASGKSLLWAADVLGRHRHAYAVFAQWQQKVADQAMVDERIESPLGWPMAVHAGTSKRTLLNFPEQAGGADMMRLAAIAAPEAGIEVIAPVHDAFWIMAPLAELNDAIATMSGIMTRAGRAVAGGIEIAVEVSATVRAPQCLGDVRKADAKGQALWNEIKGLLQGGLQQTEEVRHETATA